MIRVVSLALGLLLWAGAGGVTHAQDYHTPRAGDAYTTTLWGETVNIAPRDRRSVTAVNLGLYWIPDGPQKLELLPFGALFVWRNRDEGKTRFRGSFSVLYNDLRYAVTPSFLGGAEAVLTFENLTVPFARSAYVEGMRIGSEELTWYQLHAGIGLGYRRALPPGHQDNALELALTYEPGLLAFDRGDDTAPTFIIPANTYEGRGHFRMRADALERNILELPHHGIVTGLDGWFGHRTHWSNWGGGPSGMQSGSDHRNWSATSGYLIVAGGLPFVRDEHHRFIASAYGGIGDDLDQFSAFHLDGIVNGGEWEALSRPFLPGAAFDEFFPTEYALLNAEYRYELFFFLYLQLRGSLAWIDRPRFDSGNVVTSTDALHSITIAATSGFVWDSLLELGYIHNFGLFRVDDGVPKLGGEAVFISWSKEL